MHQFSLYQENIFRLLREGKGAEIEKEEFFYSAIKRHANIIARNCNAEVTINPTRAREAQSLWEKDLKALINDKKLESSQVPCEFKHAAFLCYWLRRRVVVENSKPLDPGKGVINKDFKDYRNEYIALHIALDLALFHFYFPSAHEKRNAESVLGKQEFPQELIHEALVLLHHKNVSPHSIYLFFKALVTNLPPPKNNAKSKNHLNSV